MANFLNEVALQTEPLIPPDGQTVIWPAVHDPKFDTIVVLQTGLKFLGLGDVPVVKEGSFEPSLVVRDGGDGRLVTNPAVFVVRSSDAESRTIGRLFGVRDQNSPDVIDPTGALEDADAASFRGAWSDVTIDVTICDINTERADYMYVIVKHIMLAALPEFMRIGYIDVRRLSGEDVPISDINAPTPDIFVWRYLQYAMKFPDYLVTVETLGRIVKQTLTITDEGEQESTLIKQAAAMWQGAGAAID